jgi:hypothetical protein
VNRTRKKSEVSIEEIEKVLQYPVYAQIPEDAKAVKGISIGTPVVLSAPKSEAGKAFTNLGRTLIGAPEVSKRRSPFRRKEAAVAPPVHREARPTVPNPWAAATVAPNPSPLLQSLAEKLEKGAENEVGVFVAPGGVDQVQTAPEVTSNGTSNGHFKMNGHVPETVVEAAPRIPFRDAMPDYD